ncbi:OLC1v1014534C1 [Oldenlandia corymbosa var. corymbosa]|uniref:OLC1v1014534C1 n=1 Tax=Oldenlandia corymbosa var. corymbosa TaxID=529605 RepID=A0AAV1E4I2_OLDCO|nr:OLC1v1014534C1 [Oldenlandia corymbosa var. corymbosa]
MKKGTLFFFSILLFLQLQQDLALGDLHRLENQAFQLASHKQQGESVQENLAVTMSICAEKAMVKN